MSLFPGFLGGLQKIVAILMAPTTADPTISTGTPAISYRTDLDRLRLQDVAGNMHSLAHVDELSMPVSLRQALTGAGIANLTAATTRCTTAAAGDAVSLAAGAAAGFRKTITQAVNSHPATDTTVITPAGFNDGTTITLINKGDSVTLESTVSGWDLVSYSGTPTIA